MSPLCLGAMTFGEGLGWGSTVADSETIIDRYLAVGGNFIDTANFGYAKGHLRRRSSATTSAASPIGGTASCSPRSS